MLLQVVLERSVAVLRTACPHITHKISLIKHFAERIRVINLMGKIFELGIARTK